ncbi:MAG: site-specific integrase [Bacteroidales bacterium]|nr:site-specific integrase [Bacteroidales bacterium]
MNASISVVCYKSKTLANGENPLMIQISKDGKRKYQSLGLSVNQKFWDFSKNRPKFNCPNGEYIQQIILNKITELQKQILILGADSLDFTLNGLLNGKNQKIKEKKVGEYFHELINQFEIAGNVGNKKVYAETLNSIKSFSKGNMNFIFSDIDLEWLIRYEKWMRKKGNKETSISLRFRTLRSAYNKAIDSKSATKINYPFNDFKISKFDVTTNKRAISKNEILLIKSVDLINEIESVQFSRDIFIFSYLCGGINFTDIANLTSNNIIDNRVQYIRQKTGKTISLQISSDAKQIISRYNHEIENRGYLFPILDKRVHKTAQQKQNRIHKILGKTGNGLKKIAELCEIKTNLTTYVARHSFATVLKNSGVNIALICEALGHSDLSTTQIYLDSFESEQINEAMKHLL